VKYTCPCCGYKTLSEKPPGSDDICEICFWHDDYIQVKDPDYWGGANDSTLREAQKNFTEFGAKEKRVIDFVRKPTNYDVKDIDCTPL